LSGKDDLTDQTTKAIPIGSDDPKKKGTREPATLILMVGPQELVGKQWKLDKKSSTIGRYSASEIHVPEKSLSKAHARLSVADDVVSISDLGATNGTFVNGKKLTPYSSYQLRHNDQIKAGSVTFKFLDKA
jgi:pSer/pThr/pTyr-binding forkhead associated (FHA) protein